MNRVLISVLVICLLFVGNSCNKFIKCYGIDCTSPPEPIVFRILKDSNDLVYEGVYNPDSIQIFFKQNSNVILVETIIQIDETNKSANILSFDIAWKSLENQKDFFLKLADNEIDTVYLDVITVTRNCCTSHPVKELTVNGIRPSFDDEHWCYVINK